MKKLILLSVLFIVGCANIFITPTKTLLYENGSSIKLVSDLNIYDGSIEYKSRQFLLEQIDKKADIEMLSIGEINVQKEDVSEGGRITVSINTTISLDANDIMWDCKIQKMNGDAVNYRIVGSPYKPVYVYGTYVSVFSVYIDEPMNEPFKVFLIHKGSTPIRNDYIVYPNEDITSITN